MKGLRKHIASSDTLYSAGSIEVRLMARLQQKQAHIFFLSKVQLSVASYGKVFLKHIKYLPILFQGLDVGSSAFLLLCSTDFITKLLFRFDIGSVFVSICRVAIISF